MDSLLQIHHRPYTCCHCCRGRCCCQLLALSTRVLVPFHSPHPPLPSSLSHNSLHSSSSSLPSSRCPLPANLVHLQYHRGYSCAYRPTLQIHLLNRTQGYRELSAKPCDPTTNCPTLWRCLSTIAWCIIEPPSYKTENIRVVLCMDRSRGAY